MALQPRAVKSSSIALKYGALSSLIPTSVYLILFLLNLLIHNLDQTRAYIFNIFPFTVPTLTTGPLSIMPQFSPADWISFGYQGIAFGLVVAIAAGMSGRWAVEQTGKTSTALLQGLWVGCGFGLLITLIIVIQEQLILFGGTAIQALNMVIAGQDSGGYALTALLSDLILYLINYLIYSSLAILFGMLGGWLGCKVPRKQAVASSSTPVVTPTSTN